jgi:DNA ligase 1
MKRNKCKDKIMESVIKFIDEVNSTNSSVEKQQKMKKYIHDKTICNVISYTMDPLKQFNISSNNVKKYQTNKKYKDQPFKKYKNVFKLLDDLTNKVITGNEALKTVNEYIKNLSPKHQNVIYCILDKNLKIRMNAATVNKVYNRNIIKMFEPVLAKNYDPNFNKLNDDWVISQKLDGVRCLINVNPVTKKIKGYSRTGKDLYNIDIVLKEIPIHKIKESVFLDGELVYINKNNGDEDFTKTIEIVRKSKNNKEIKELGNLFYKIFDMIPETEFYETKGISTYKQRLKQIKQIFVKNSRIKIVKQIPYSIENFEMMNNNVSKHGWEGLMLRDTIKPYKGKRIRDLCKVKKFLDEEYKVIDIINGPFRMIDKNTKLEVTIECMAAVIINYKKTKVGSGFSIEERQKYYKDPSKIIGKTITVQYFEKTPDSLRFPTFKGIRDYE